MADLRLMLSLGHCRQPLRSRCWRPFAAPISPSIRPRATVAIAAKVGRMTGRRSRGKLEPQFTSGDALWHENPAWVLALGSGAARGWAHIGIIRALERLGRQAGSGGWLLHRQLRRRCLRCWRTGQTGELGARFLNRLQVMGLLDPPSPAACSAVTRCSASPPAIWGSRHREPAAALRLRRHRTRYRPRDLVCSRPLRQCVRASCGMPGILTPTRIDDRWLVDGAVVNPAPISLARAMGPRW